MISNTTWQNCMTQRRYAAPLPTTFGGFIIVGVKDAAPDRFEVVGIDPDKELYGHFCSKVKVEPDIDIQPPKVIEIPSGKVVVVFEIPQSPRRPHLPSVPDRRFFWKRKGSDCTQMTLEEIRYQMNLYEEKREKLSLLLIDLHHKLRAIRNDGSVPDGEYTGNLYAFEIIDTVVVEAYALLKTDVNTLGALETIPQQLLLLNAEKQKMWAFLALSYMPEDKKSVINNYRDLAKRIIPGVTILSDQIEKSLLQKLSKPLQTDNLNPLATTRVPIARGRARFYGHYPLLRPLIVPPFGRASPPPQLCGPMSASVGLRRRVEGRLAARPKRRSPA
jgi:hypothetical protein